MFGITVNHSGSTFLRQALATSRAVWSLPDEGQFVLGYAGPSLENGALAGAFKIWGSRRRWLDALQDESGYDWVRTREAWYFQARAHHPCASTFFTNSPPHLLVVDALNRYFDNPRFLFMVRNPYATCAGIYRDLERLRPAMPRGGLAQAAARHVVACFDRQRRNIETWGNRGTFFTYETMCAEPERVAAQIEALVPDIDDLNLRQRLPVKGRYNEELTDMNARQIAQIEPERLHELNQVFREHRELLGHFGYGLMSTP